LQNKPIGIKYQLVGFIREAMMYWKNLFLATLLVSMTTAVKASSTEYATPEEARALLERAIAEVNKDKAAAIRSFNHNAEPFRDRDLFVFCFNGDDGKFTAHEAFVTHDVRELRDSNQAPFGAEMYNSAQAGWITEIVFVAPLAGTTNLAVKSAYVTRIGDQVCGVSAYQGDGPGKPVKIAQPQRW
jgi:hypothetical protein